MSRRSGRLLGPKLLGAVLAVILPATVLAVASPFNDVISSNPYFYNIVNMANSGISSGCGGGNFCPTANVTREQMSAFLNRAAPRASSVNFNAPLGNSNGGQAADGGVVGSVSVQSLNNEYIYISTAFFTFTYDHAGTFPCENSYRFQVDGANVGNASMYDRELTQPANTWDTKQIAGQTMVSVGPGTHVVTLVYHVGTGSCSNFPGNGTLTAMVIPFDGLMGSIP